jgi:hypothetical protein
MFSAKLNQPFPKSLKKKKKIKGLHACSTISLKKDGGGEVFSLTDIIIKNVL